MECKITYHKVEGGRLDVCFKVIAAEEKTSHGEKLKVI